MAGVPVRVLIADYQGLMAAGTTAALDPQEGFEVVGLATNASEAGALAEAEHPDVALVHVHLPGGGEAAVRAILSGSPDTRVLAHSGVADNEIVIAMLRAGGSGYAVRDASPEKLRAALRGALAGDTVFDDVVGRGVIHELMEHVHEANRLHEQRVTKRARIRSVMERDELDIVFQPIVALDSRAIVGYEALARFSTLPHRGPVDWFRDAHDVGLGAELELWAIRRAWGGGETM
jgi:DNA-binding NarL/FixJ family response regulator